MLSNLRIKNIVLIEHLEIEFYNGLCSLTGETGAGKSILLDSLGLATGARADSSLVRKGQEQASVTATFEIPADHVAKTLMEDQGLEFDETLMLRRTLKNDGKSRAFINDQPVSAGFLKTIGATLLEIHGQFDTQGLMNAKTHRSLLDEYGGIDGTLLQKCWDAWKEAESNLQILRDSANASAEEEQYLRTSLEDLDALEPKAGEEQTLADLRESLMHREQVLQALGAAYHALNSESDPVREAWSTLDRVGDKLPENARSAIAALERASAEITEALAEIQSASSQLEHSEHDLESIDERLYALRNQARKHNCEVDELVEKREELAVKLNAIEHADDALETALGLVESQKNEYYNEAVKVSKTRQKAAEKLDILVAKELPPLKLERAIFKTGLSSLTELSWEKSCNSNGIDNVEFMVSTNGVNQLSSLSGSASGGEMSRFMLAIKVVMAEIGTAQTLIFDEVDAGIGGSTADAVGERLAALAKEKQLLVVTHSPQVAARGNHHYTVSKDGDTDVVTTVAHLDSAQKRREEIARMLAGATITTEVRAAADKLLETAA